MLHDCTSSTTAAAAMTAETTAAAVAQAACNLCCPTLSGKKGVCFDLRRGKESERERAIILMIMITSLVRWSADF